MGQYTLAELVITDGSNLVDLLYHFKLAGWQPATATYKDGGVFQDSPIADGRRLVQRYYQNLTETFQLAIKAGKINSAISDLNRLRSMLESAADYWASDWNDTKVWIEARGVGETNRRYALVVAGQAPNDPNPYASPFAGPFGNVGLVEVMIEHLIWLDVKPTSWNETPVSAMRNLGGGFAVGNVDENGARATETDGTVFFSNSDANYNDLDTVNFDLGGYITHVASDTFAAPANLVNESVSLATTLIDTTGIAVDKAIYFGSTVAAFSNLILNLSVARVNFTIGTWEYWSSAAGGSWVALSNVIDKTSGLSLTGVKEVNWTFPSTWVQTAVTVDGGAVNGWWVRVRITVAPVAAYTAPVQAAQVIYTANWPFVEVQEEDVSGTLPALLRAIMQRYNTNTDIDRILVGLRSMDRGIDFSHMIDLGVSASGGGGTFTQADQISFSAGIVSEAYVGPSGYRLKYAPVAAGSETITIDWSSTDRNIQWLGRFRVLIRYTTTDNVAGYFAAEVVTLRGSATSATTGSAFLNNTTDDYAVAGIGTLDTKGATAISESSTFQVQITLTATQGAVDDGAILYLYDLILLPIDEYSADIKIDDATAALSRLAIVLDSLQGRWQSRSYANSGSTFNTQIEIIGQSISPGPAILQKQARQRLHFVLIDTSSSHPTAPPHLMMAVKLQHQSRYHGMRGDE